MQRQVSGRQQQNACQGKDRQGFGQLRRGLAHENNRFTPVADRDTSFIPVAVATALAVDIMTDAALECSAISKPVAVGTGLKINEQGDRAQQGDDIIVLKECLQVQPWLKTAKKYVANPADYPDPYKEILAVDGVKAPTGTVLEVKGAFIDEDGIERVPNNKKDRSLQINLYGYT